MDFEDNIRMIENKNQMRIDLENIWKNNKESSEKVLNLFDDLIQKINTEQDLVIAAEFILHIAIKYLFAFDECIKKIKKLLTLNCLQNDLIKKQLELKIIILNYSKDQKTKISDRSISDRVAIFAYASLTHFLLNKNEIAEKMFENALTASLHLSGVDPVIQSWFEVCVDINLILEQKKELSVTQKKILIDAAHIQQKYAETKNWQHRQYAEYRLNSIYRKVFEFKKAEMHGLNCWKICQNEKANSQKMFYACEALAKTYKLLEQLDKYEYYSNEARKYLSMCSEVDQKKLLNLISN